MSVVDHVAPPEVVLNEKKLPINDFIKQGNSRVYGDIHWIVKDKLASFPAAWNLRGDRVFRIGYGYHADNTSRNCIIGILVSKMAKSTSGRKKWKLTAAVVSLSNEVVTEYVINHFWDCNVKMSLSGDEQLIYLTGYLASVYSRDVSVDSVNPALRQKVLRLIDIQKQHKLRKKTKSSPESGSAKKKQESAKSQKQGAHQSDAKQGNTTSLLFFF